MPRVSIILHASNAGATIGETIQSLSTQTYRDFEVVLIDDGSTDQTAEEAQRFCRNIALRVIRHQSPTGLAKSLNEGLRDSDSEFVARIESCDLATPNRLQAQLSFLEQILDVDICGSAMQVFTTNEGGEKFDEYALSNPSEDPKIRTALLQRSAIAPTSAMYRKTVFSDVGLYDPEMDSVEDYDFWCRASMRGKKFANLPEVLMRYRTRPPHVSGRETAPQYERDQAIKARYYKHLDPRIEGTALSRLLSLSTSFVNSDDLLQTIADCLGPLSRLAKVAPDMGEFVNLLILCKAQHFGVLTTNKNISSRPPLRSWPKIPAESYFLLNYLKGGIGNQLFQHAFAISLGRRLGCEVRADLSFYANDPYGNDSIIHSLYPEIAESQISSLTGNGHYMLNDVNVKSLAGLVSFPTDARTVVLNGYWQGEEYIDREAVDDIYSRLCGYGEKNAAMDLIHRLKSSSNPVALHIRRGDYAHMGLCKDSYYIAAIEFLKKRHPDVTIYLFSDEPNFSKHLLSKSGHNFECVNGKDALSDLYLMSLCKHFVISNSTFSWWGAYFGETRGGIIICPKEWVTIDSSASPCPARWVQIEGAVTPFSISIEETISFFESIAGQIP